MTKTVKMDNDDLSALYIKSKCEKGDINLKISQGSKAKVFNISDTVNEVVDMTEFGAGLIKMVLTIKDAKNLKVVSGWRR